MVEPSAVLEFESPRASMAKKNAGAKMEWDEAYWKWLEDSGVAGNAYLAAAFAGGWRAMGEEVIILASRLNPNGKEGE